MNKASVVNLVSQAHRHLNQTPVFLIRASSNFLVKESLDNAIYELKESQKILELAKLIHSSSSPVSITTSPSLS
jgi:hypothetical protein